MWRNFNKRLCSFLVLCILSFIYFLNFNYLSEPNFSGTNFTILLWHWPFGKPYSLYGDVCREQYGYHGCLLVDNRSWFSRADLVVFHHRELKSGKQSLPMNLSRPRGQRWVWMSLENPETNGNFQDLNGHFDIIMSYRRDANITIPYGKLVPKETENTSMAGALIPSKKTSLVCWVVSNYSKKHKRSAVYDELRKIIKIDVYGKAVKRPLKAEHLLPTISRCYFYLAFENSISTDYITEKFWRNALVGGAVPVVLGPPREQYEAVAPKDSFIHVEDFKSIKELGEFLKKLAEDKERYATYFAWKEQYSVKLYTDWRDRLCSICPKRSHHFL